MSNTSLRDSRITGVLGVTGGMLFVLGDLLMYGHAGSASSFHQGMMLTLQQAPLWRLFLGGMLGPPAACLCLVGFWHVWLNLEKSHTRNLFRLLASAGYIGFGAVHTLWIAKALALRSCADASLGCRPLLQNVNQYWNLVWYVAAIPAFIASALLAQIVLFGRSNYPRWAVFFNPALLYAASLLTVYAPAPWGAPLVGVSDNLGLPIFLIFSLAVTWTVRPRKHVEAA